MSKKDYEAIAAILNKGRRFATTTEEVKLVENIAKDMGLLFADSNPRFDTARFYAAVQK